MLMTAACTSRVRAVTRIHGERSAEEATRSHPADCDAAGDARPQSRLDGVETLVGSHVEPSGHEDDDGEAESSQRGQPRQDAGCHGEHEAGSAEDLREAYEDHQRTGQLREPGALCFLGRSMSGATRWS
jgi:hypothetical protein